MSQKIRGPIDLTGKDPNYYESSYLERVAWVSDPLGTEGLLCVRINGKDYFHTDEPEETYNILEELARRDAEPPEELKNEYETAGEYFAGNIKQRHEMANKMSEERAKKFGLEDSGAVRFRDVLGE